MKASELKSMIRTILKEESRLLSEEDTKFFASPEYVEKKLELAYKQTLKKFKDRAKKGYLSYNDLQIIFNTFGNESKAMTDVDTKTQRELRKKYGTPGEQDRKK